MTRLSEEEDGVVGRGYEHVLDEIVLFRPHAGNTLPTTPLPAVRADRKTFDVTGVRYRDGHVLFGDQIFYREVRRRIHYLRPTLIAVRLDCRVHVLLDHPEHLCAAFQNALQHRDELDGLFVLLLFIAVYW